MALDNRRLADLAAHDAFIQRHNGPREQDVKAMLAELDMASLDTLIERTVPADIRLGDELDLDPPKGEAEALGYLSAWRPRTAPSRATWARATTAPICPR